MLTPKEFEKICKKIAKKDGVSVEEVKRSMAEAIEKTFEAPEGSSARQSQLELFPDGKTPTTEEFIIRMVEYLMDKELNS